MTGTARPSTIAELARQMLDITRKLPLSGTYSPIDGLTALFRRIQQEHGDHTLEAAARCLLLKMTDGTYWVPHCQVPDSIRTQVVGQRERIHREAMAKPLGYYHPFKALFSLDFSLLRGKTLPLECIILDTQVALKRRPLNPSSLVQRLQFLRLLLRKPVATRYFLHMHLHPAMLGTFSETGWWRNYHMVGDLLALNPSYKGVTGTSWFYDPAIERLSPQLSYLSREPIRGGAKRYLAGTSPGSPVLSAPAAIQALQPASGHRPRAHTLVWHRNALLSWHKRQSRPSLRKIRLYRAKE